MTKAWTIQSMLHWMTEYFGKKGLSTPRLDAEVLLADSLECKRIDLYLKFDQLLNEQELNKIRSSVQRRSQNEPVAYIVGQQEFYGRAFQVGPGCLIPRPETEQIIDEAISFFKAQSLQPLDYLDIATGSGCIASSVILEAKKLNLQLNTSAVEISESALAYFKKNLQAVVGEDAAKVEVFHADFYEWSSLCEKKFDLITCNPPYVAKGAPLSDDVKNFEPALALYGGDQGDEILKQWLPKMTELLKPGGLILCEMGFDQKKSVEKIFASTSDPQNEYNCVVVKDLSGHDRVAKIWR